MEISIKSISLFTAVMLTGLSAGLFYAWSVSVIPGTRKIMDPAYLESMQSINRAILNPAFFLIFFGSLIMLGVSSWQHAHGGLIFWLLLGATLTYLIGTFGVTAFGNVPLNNELDTLMLKSCGAEKLMQFRHYYETEWNTLHQIRMVFAVIAFLLSLLSAFIPTKTI